MKKIISTKLFRFFIILISILSLTVIGMKLFSMRTHDPDNPRSRTNSYLMSHTVTIKRPPEQVFDFITYHMAEHNLSIAKAHEHFEFIKGEGITEGAVFVSEEYQEDEGVKNTYVVQKIIPNQLIYYSSTPSLIYTKKNGQWEQTGACNAYVYFDIEDDFGHSKVTQTLVIQMPNFMIKFIIDLIAATAENNEWQDHLVEELEGLKSVIEVHA